MNIAKYLYYHQYNGEAGHLRNCLARGLGIQQSAFSYQPSAFCPLPSAFCLLPTAFCLLPSAYCLLPTAYCLLPASWVARGRLSPEQLLPSRGARYLCYNNATVNFVKQKILPSGRNLLKRGREARGPYSTGRHAGENVAQGSLSSLAAFPPRRGFGGAAYENSDYLVCGAVEPRRGEPSQPRPSAWVKKQANLFPRMSPEGATE
jgi:hypothetical protein